MDGVLVTLEGESRADQLERLAEVVAEYGLAITAIRRIDRATGKLRDPRARRLNTLVYVDDSWLARHGFGTVEDVARLTMLDAWRMLRRDFKNYLSRIGAYMAAHEIPFADGPARPIADGWARYSYQKKVVLPGLDLNARILGALGQADVLCVELLSRIPDAELAEVRNLSPKSVQAIRLAQRRAEA